MSAKILIPTKLDKVAADILVKAGFEVILDGNTKIDELCALHPDAVGLIVRSEKVTPKVMDALPQLKVVVRAGAGYDNIDLRHATKRFIAVMNTPGANSNAVAEEALGLMIAAGRYFIDGDRTTRAGQWEKAKYLGSEVTGKTIGILGFGNIGQLLARRLKGFEVKILVYDPFVSVDKARDFGAEITTMEDVFARADLISLHLPVTDETRNVISTKLLQSMKDGAILVNCARYEIVDEAALREVKKVKKFFFATDVYPEDAPGMKSCADVADIMLPHVGANTKEANANAARNAARQLAAFLQEGITTFVLNKQLPDGLAPEYQKLAHVLAKMARQVLLGEKGKPHELQISFYGELKKYTRYLLHPAVAAISNNADILDYDSAIAYLESAGINLKLRDADDGKGYGDSITLDLISAGEHLQRLSLRGTVAESNIIISRIADFEKLYFEPFGNSVIFTYADRPGVLAQITQALAFEGINIDDIRSPHNAEGTKSIAVLKVNGPVSHEFVAKIAARLGCELAASLHI